jgi:hypothetical protein
MDISTNELGIEASHLFKGHDRSVLAFWTDDDHPRNFINRSTFYFSAYDQIDDDEPFLFKVMRVEIDHAVI